jgi:ribosome-associated protein
VVRLSDNETDEIVALGLKLASSADDVKGENIRLLDLRGRCAYTDAMLFVSGASDRQVRAIADRISKRATELGMPTVGHEGTQSGNWVLLDHGDVVVHVFYRPARMYYDLESLWADAPEIPLGFITEQSPF